MNHRRFAAELPALYHNWGSEAVCPKSDRFERVLRQVRGMTTTSVLQLLNLAVDCLEPGELYAEVGCFQGATLIGALLDRPACRASAVDNFSEFDPQGGNRAALHNNLAAFGLAERVAFYNMDFEEFFLGRGRPAPGKIGVYLYDGAHDYRSQLVGLLLAIPWLADRALIIVDDANSPAVRQATWDFLAVQADCRLLFEMLTRGNCDPSFWNGVYVLSRERGTANGYAWPDFQARRQTALLESLTILQSVVLQREGDRIALRKA